jgi:excisionase family DNA binding protein
MRPRPAPDPLLLKPSTVSKLLNLSDKSVARMIAKGELPSRRIAGRAMVPTAEFRSWLEGLPGVTASEALRNLAQRALITGLRPEVVETDDQERA